MPLPNIDKAQVSESKISRYLLADDHPTGRGKALFFRKLGFRKHHPDALRRALLQHAAGNEVGSFQRTSFGTKYLNDDSRTRPGGAEGRHPR